MILYPHYGFQLIINCGIFACVFFPAALIVRKSADRAVVVPCVFLMISIGLSMVPVTLVYYNFTLNALVLAPLYGFPFLIGPIVYFYSGAVSGNLSGRKATFILNTVPAPLFSLLYFIFFQYLDFPNLMRITSTLQYIHVHCYLIAAVRINLVSLQQRKKKDPNIMATILILVIYLITQSILLGPPIVTGSYLHPAATAGTLILCVHFILIQRYPSLMGLQERKYTVSAGSLSASRDYEELHKLLMEKLEVERIYLYEDLTISMLAQEMEIHNYQLSRFLNSYMGKNFNSLINSYRVRDARHKLIHEPDKSILAIAFEVGFNSKASFNRVFKQVTKLSPSDYRDFFGKLSKEHIYF